MAIVSPPKSTTSKVIMICHRMSCFVMTICDTYGDFHGDSDADAGHSPDGLLDVRLFGLSKAP